MSIFNHISTWFLLRCRFFFIFSLLLRIIISHSKKNLLEAGGEELQEKNLMSLCNVLLCSRKRVIGHQGRGKYKTWNTWFSSNSVLTVLSAFSQDCLFAKTSHKEPCLHICNLRAICKIWQQCIPFPFPRWRAV